MIASLSQRVKLMTLEAPTGVTAGAALELGASYSGLLRWRRHPICTHVHYINYPIVSYITNLWVSVA